jgi:hypothetical protein
MASPIAHSVAGFWTFLVFAKQLQIRLAEQWRQYLPRLGVLVIPGVRHETSRAIFQHGQCLVEYL